MMLGDRVQWTHRCLRGIAVGLGGLGRSWLGTIGLLCAVPNLGRSCRSRRSVLGVGVSIPSIRRCGLGLAVLLLGCCSRGRLRWVPTGSGGRLEATVLGCAVSLGGHLPVGLRGGVWGIRARLGVASETMGGSTKVGAATVASAATLRPLLVVVGVLPGGAATAPASPTTPHGAVEEPSSPWTVAAAPHVLLRPLMCLSHHHTF